MHPPTRLVVYQSQVVMRTFLRRSVTTRKVYLLSCLIVIPFAMINLCTTNETGTLYSVVVRSQQHEEGLLVYSAEHSFRLDSRIRTQPWGNLRRPSTHSININRKVKRKAKAGLTHIRPPILKSSFHVQAVFHFHPSGC